MVAIIPAREGSKRLIGKNKMKLCGKPLILYTIEQALNCSFIDEIIISTNDDEIIDIIQGIQYGYLYGLPDNRLVINKRPEALSTDESNLNDVILYELRDYPDLTTVILLQPTSPLRNIWDIGMAYQIFKDRVSCTVVPVFREDDYRFKLNGAVFVFSLAVLKLTNNILAGEFLTMYIMPKERSVDIDTIEDFKEAEKFMRSQLQKELSYEDHLREMEKEGEQQQNKFKCDL